MGSLNEDPELEETLMGKASINVHFPSWVVDRNIQVFSLFKMNIILSSNNQVPVHSYSLLKRLKKLCAEISWELEMLLVPLLGERKPQTLRGKVLKL